MCNVFGLSSESVAEILQW